MALFTCKMCGGALEVKEGMSVCECPYCGTMQTLPNLDDEKKIRLYDRANHFRRNSEFDKAIGMYESILEDDDKDAEAYWSLVLCRYGIEYVEDPETHKRVPTVNRAQYTSVLVDENYLSAIKFADSEQRALYEAEAKTIDDIQKGILDISNNEEPFDVFICYKETDEKNNRTQDSVYANDIYNALTEEGYKVFFSRISLEDKLGTEYEPYIFAALNSAAVMVVVGTCSENLNAVWVKNEWSRYLSLVKAGENKTLIPVYKDMDPYDLPEEFSYLQAQDMNKVGFMQDLVRGVKKIVSQDVIDERQKQGTSSVIVDTMTKRGSDALANGDWDTAIRCYDSILDYDSRNIDALIGKLKAIKKVRNLEESKTPLDTEDTYKKLLQFANETTKTKVAKWNEKIKKKNRANNKKKIIIICSVTICFILVISLGFLGIKYILPESKYKKASNYMTNGEYVLAIEKFDGLGDYKDSKKQLLECQYLLAFDLLNNKEYEKAIIQFKKCNDYKESNVNIQKCYYLSATSFFDSKNYKKATELFEKCKDYKDSQTYITKASLASAQIEDTIKFGSYYGEDIEWKVVDKQEGKILLFADKVLDEASFNDTEDNATWEKCSLRKWLNTDFLNKAFSSNEQNLIAITKIKNENNHEFGTFGGNETEDRIFLFSYEEAYHYLDEDNLIAMATDIAKSHGAAFPGNGYYWWTRTIGYHDNYAVYIQYFQTTELYGSINSTVCGVRPALWINIS